MEFQKLATEALSSNYGRANVFNKNLTLRLVTAVINRSDLISEAITTKGYTFYFESSDIEKEFEKGSHNFFLKAPDFAAIKLDGGEDDKPNLIL